MATEGTVVESPASSPAASSGAAADPKAQPGAGVKPAASQPDYKWEDDTRTKGTLADLQKERKARQEFQDAVAASKAEAAEWRRKVEALSGIVPPDPKQADTKLVRAKILELMPELADLGSIAEMKAAIEDQQVQGYASHSRRIMAQIHQGIAAEYGDLTARQKRRIDAAYLYENQSSPEFHARHNQGDPALVAEFVKEMIEDLVDPIKRKATTAEAARFRPVPGGRDRSTPLKGEKPKSGEDMLRAHFKAHAR
jgi:hypothetical protein